VICNPHFHARNGYILAVHPTDAALPGEFREQTASVVSAISGERKPGMNVIGTSRIGVVFPRLILDRSDAMCIPSKRRFLSSFPVQSDVS
jgi:hypothetical protein